MKVVGAVGVAGLALAVNAGTGFASTQASANGASSSAANASATGQHATQNQQSTNSSGGGGGLFSTGGGGNIALQSQGLGQSAFTSQLGASLASANTRALNANVPVTINGFGTVDGVSSGGANQAALNSADSNASNTSSTSQGAGQNQQAVNSSGSDGAGLFGTGGGGNITPQSQDLGQNASTLQHALSAAQADQQLVNANVPVTVNGFGRVGSVGAFDGGANQVGINHANSSANNASMTSQGANQNQASANGSAGFGGLFGTGGGGNVNPQQQILNQAAHTLQDLASLGTAVQGLSNSGTPVSIG